MVGRFYVVITPELRFMSTGGDDVRIVSGELNWMTAV